ncbi:helix-turn-helix domain-containing protein [Citrobacter freundii]|uniref:Helix-turn-helix domain-containing protein n=2 Tax=Citrobacter freundii complex TaxID=1344959 RepID=A0AAP9TW90_CITFR|nr:MULTISPECIES: helix-turn-helix domain-containing protein [Citrobacter]EBJ4770218.1 helix-turn-helix domain-containing protein [Salmonella enterica]EDR4558000.1 helix-turn-helix domain-containing protein [Salmonella enterica subsp. enterica serovar Miami]EFJ8790918.1 helix-turn-helix domain-containing protein [Escherichia coli]EBT6964894.1 helix-turn-helix domain-containing protein [Salmonella enterica]EBT8488172.1 helix-turn-helix domain-containing protein [Salmonella enterica]
MKPKTHQIDHPQVRRLNELMDLKGATKADLARVAGVSPQSVNNWFARGTLGKNSALKIAEAFGVSVAWVLGEEVDESLGLKEKELRLLKLFNQLPESEQDRMLDTFELRLKEIDEYVEKYLRGRFKKE